jgi:hypothetical protein
VLVMFLAHRRTGVSGDKLWEMPILPLWRSRERTTVEQELEFVTGWNVFHVGAFWYPIASTFIRAISPKVIGMIWDRVLIIWISQANSINVKDFELCELKPSIKCP